MTTGIAVSLFRSTTPTTVGVISHKTMILLTSLLVFCAALLFLFAGYLLGARKGVEARANLRDLSRGFAKEIVRLRALPSVPVKDDGDLRATLQEILSPLVQREQLSYDMLLSDAQGWRVAASSTTTDTEKLGATASLMLLMADRIARDGSPSPLSLMFHDTANTTTLCRVFSVDNQRMTLTVVANGAQLTPAALDPVLAKLNAMLLNKAG